ncbi:hypothetical protein ERJ75_000658900 [Trypanosoma vivax]|nr:hypothetical protein TRVL_06995 [Trypanosoma vivax]KAH8614711.1 hypothetical protein ERJ75_000658900 [Trypanosoma vivax]
MSHRASLAFTVLQLGNLASMHDAGFNLCNIVRYFDDIVLCELPVESAASVIEEMRSRVLDVEFSTLGVGTPFLFKRLFSNLYQDGGSELSAIDELSGESG